MNESVILIIDPRGMVLSNKSGAIARHVVYKNILSKFSSDQNYKLRIFSACKQVSDVSFGDLSFLERITNPTFNSLLFAFKSARRVKIERLNVKLLIVADPWESFWSAVFLRVLLNKRIPIQVQIHADLGNYKWKKANLKNRIRFELAKLSLGRADAIRTVGKTQTNLIIESFKLEEDKISILPIPLINHATAEINTGVRPRTIAFIGRIESDRGIWEFITLIKLIVNERRDFKLVIIGSGSEEQKFKAGLEEILPSSSIEYLGYLSSSEINDYWNQIGVLVSLAPTESYGLTLREAIIGGVPVWASKSSGVQDLKETVGNEVVNELDFSDSGQNMAEVFERIIAGKIKKEIRLSLIDSNQKYARNIVKNWVDLIGKQREKLP